jgi:hypothetical protein
LLLQEVFHPAALRLHEPAEVEGVDPVRRRGAETSDAL